MRAGKGNIFLSLICPFDFFSSCLDVESHLQSHDSLILVAELLVSAPPFHTEQTEELEMDFFTFQRCSSAHVTLQHQSHRVILDHMTGFELGLEGSCSDFVLH